MITLNPAFAKPMLCAVFLVRRLGFNSLNSGQRIKNQARQFFSPTKQRRFSEFYSRILEKYSRRSAKFLKVKHNFYNPVEFLQIDFNYFAHFSVSVLKNSAQFLILKSVNFSQSFFLDLGKSAQRISDFIQFQKFKFKSKF